MDNPEENFLEDAKIWLRSARKMEIEIKHIEEIGFDMCIKLAMTEALIAIAEKLQGVAQSQAAIAREMREIKLIMQRSERKGR